MAERSFRVCLCFIVLPRAAVRNRFANARRWNRVLNLAYLGAAVWRLDPAWLAPAAE